MSDTEVTSVKEKLSDADVMQLELAKLTRLNALAQAEKAMAQNEAAELKYKNLVLQIYLKYGLTEADAINPSGEIIRGGALQDTKV